MDLLAPAAIVGALVGLIVGWVDYRIVGGIVERKLRQTDRSSTAMEKDEFERRIVWFHRLLMIATVGLFPIIGYWLGRTIGT